MRVWAKLKHPNVLPLLGFIMSGPYPSLISEWMENGSLSTFMKMHPDADAIKMVRISLLLRDMRSN
jgi:serine/threonine protein kinase